MNKSLSLICAGVLMCLSAAVAAVVVPSLQGCGCGAIGCGSGAALSFDVADDVVVPYGSTASACFNDTCVTGTVESTSMIMGRAITFPSESRVHGAVWPPGTTDRDRVEITWQFPNDARFQAGDRYSAMLLDPSGAIIAMKEATATSYSTFDTCDGTCYSAQFPQ